MRLVLALLVALGGIAAPATAQGVAAVAEAPIDPAALAAAAPVVDRIWPLGTYKRMMDGMMSTMVDGMIGSMFGMKASDAAAMAGAKADGSTGDATIGDLAAKADPAFRERMDITMKVMMGEMAGLMTALEPEVRTALTRAYARRFSPAQLADIARFFATPSGAAFAGQSMLMYTDPEMMRSMQTLTPTIMKAMPAILQKVEAATAHLPPPPTRNPAP